MQTNRIQKANLVISIDDFHPQNLVLAEMFSELGLKAIFFIETMGTGNRDQIQRISELGHDTGSHTLSHPADLKQLSPEEIRGEVESSKRMIEDWTGKPCEDFCYPRGRYDDKVVEVVKAAGFKTARTTRVLQTEFQDPFRMPTTIHVFNRQEYDGKTWEQMAYFYWNHVSRKGGTFHIWGHMKELLQYGDLGRLEQFLKTIKK